MIAAISAFAAMAAAFVAFKSERSLNRLQADQWSRSELDLRRDVLRRLVAYRYRLTESLKGRDGEPFVALNEAWVVFSEFPEVVHALTKLHKELGLPGSLSRNLMDLTRAMANASDISTHCIDEDVFDRPFTPPSAVRDG